MSYAGEVYCRLQLLGDQFLVRPDGREGPEEREQLCGQLLTGLMSL